MRDYIRISVKRDSADEMVLDFPEKYTKLNIWRWKIVSLFAPVKIKWLDK